MFTTDVQWMGQRVTTLGDIIPQRPKILFVGYNPSPLSVAAGHYHQGKLGRQFWALLEKWSLVERPPLGHYHDEYLFEHGLGITDLVKRPTASANELTKEEMRHGAERLLSVIGATHPLVVCSTYKRALGHILSDETVRSRWGLLSDVTLVGSKVFLLPFPYQSVHLQDEHMPVLVGMLTKAAHQ